tara:strand:+ start:10987 stop:11295 length:309 start_codon:yes stop_codon:yes gene_type:complete
MNRLIEVVKSVEDDMEERDFVNFWTSYKLLIEQLKSKGRNNAHYDLINYLELCNDQGDMWDTSARWIKEDMAENPEKYTPKHLKDLPEKTVDTLREIHKPRS